MSRDRSPGYDVIGDIHGCCHTLIRLLELLGYRKQGGIYRHPSRKVVFTGDIIDRGPRIREALHLVYAMVEAGEAYIVMGNHEYNALTYCRRRHDGQGFLRPHTPRNNRLIRETLEQFEPYPDEWDHFTNWFMELPLFLEFERFRVVHACWDHSAIERFQRDYGGNRIDEDFLHASAEKGSFPYRVMALLTRGTHLDLPDEVEIVGGDGFTRRTFRTHFWAREPQTYGDVIFQPDNLPGDLEESLLSEAEKAKLLYYGDQEPPLFIGHYWCEGIPAVICPNIVCLDYSAVKYGRLVCYRMDGESRLDADKFVWVDVVRSENP